MARGTNAAGRVNDPISVLKPNNTAASNQVRFKNAGSDSNTNTPSVGHARVGPNTQGTGREGVPTAIALSGKRKTNLKLPANY